MLSHPEVTATSRHTTVSSPAGPDGQDHPCLRVSEAPAATRGPSTCLLVQATPWGNAISREPSGPRWFRGSGLCPPGPCWGGFPGLDPSSSPARTQGQSPEGPSAELPDKGNTGQGGQLTPSSCGLGPTNLKPTAPGPTELCLFCQRPVKARRRTWPSAHLRLWFPRQRAPGTTSLAGSRRCTLAGWPRGFRLSLGGTGMFFCG